jgi:hypothetical protein
MLTDTQRTSIQKAITLLEEARDEQTLKPAEARKFLELAERLGGIDRKLYERAHAAAQSKPGPTSTNSTLTRVVSQLKKLVGNETE